MIVLDTSAILAILLEEEEAASFRDRIGEAGGAMVSAGTAVELAAVACRDEDLFSAARAFLDEPFISVEPLDAEQAVAAGDAYRRYGKGHRASAMSSPTRLPGGGISRCRSRAGISLAPISVSLERDGFRPEAEGMRAVGGRRSRGGDKVQTASPAKLAQSNSHDRRLLTPQHLGVILPASRRAPTFRVQASRREDRRGCPQHRALERRASPRKILRFAERAADSSGLVTRRTTYRNRTVGISSFLRSRFSFGKIVNVLSQPGGG